MSKAKPTPPTAEYLLQLHEELRLLAFRIQGDVRALISISQQLAASGGPKAPAPNPPLRGGTGGGARA